MTPERNARLPALDGLRGCLALLVTLHHITSYLWLGGLSYLAAHSAVLMFFGLSGCVLTRGWDGRFGVFLARRFVRLWPPFAVAMLAASALHRQMPDLFTLIWLPPLGDPQAHYLNPPAWSLFVEAWAMLAMPAIVWASTGPIRRAAALCLAFLLGAVFVHPNLIYGPVFVAGALCSRIEHRSPLLEHPAAQWLGKVSYSLYLIHWVVLEAFVSLLGNQGVILALPVMLSAAWLLWRTVEQPTTAWSRSVGARPQTPATTHRVAL